MSTANCKQVRIHAVGDISPGDCIAPGFGVLSIAEKYSCHFLFESIRPALDGSDLLLGNLEGSLSHLCTKKNLRMCGLPGMASALKKAGFDVLSVANNHVLDHGPDVFEETVKHCQDAGLMVCGLRGTAEYYSQPVIIEKNEMKVGILAYNWVGSEYLDVMDQYIAQIHDGVVNYSWIRDSDRDAMARNTIETKNVHVINDIRELRSHVDIVVIMPHWGYEWILHPPLGVILEARSFIDAGADLILGSHPHVHQGVEIYKNKIIAYSLGNFLFDGLSEGYDSGMLIKCLVSRYGDVSEYELSILDKAGFFQPCLASAKDAAWHNELVLESSMTITDPDAIHLLNDDLIYREQEKVYKKLKYRKILFLLRTATRHPSIMGVIGLKIINLLKVIAQRVRGRKVRW